MCVYVYIYIEYKDKYIFIKKYITKPWQPQLIKRINNKLIVDGVRNHGNDKRSKKKGKIKIKSRQNTI